MRALTRRELLAGAAGTVAAYICSPYAQQVSGKEPAVPEPFGYCLNTSTIRGQELGLVGELEVAASAGYQGVEVWIRELDQYVKEGGSLDDLRKRIADLGLQIPSAIGFCEWIVDDDARREQGLEQARREMEMVKRIGGTRIAAPPVGATNQTDLNLLKAAERYRKLLEVGDQIGVVPQVEVWGFSKTLGRLGEAALVAIESGHPKACLLPDIYHLYKGGSDFEGLRLLNGKSIHVFHVNDYPAQPPRASITDADRVYPGDGQAPLATIFHDLEQIGFRGMLSLELFNKNYWSRDALTVAKLGLEKLRMAVANRTSD